MKYQIVVALLLGCFTACESAKSTNKPAPTKPRANETSSSNVALVKMSTVETLDSTWLRNHFTFKGQIKAGISWKDSSGKHVVFCCETGEYQTKSAENEYVQNAELMVYHYVQSEKKYELVWKIVDYSRECPFDVLANYKKGSLQRTDLNNNAIPEIWVAYAVSCRSDVSPSTLKLIMYEGKTKYKLEGNTLEFPGDAYVGGDITLVKNFQNNSLFYAHAQQKWKQLIRLD